MKNTHIELVKEYLLAESEAVTVKSIEEDTIYFNVTDYINFTAKAEAFYDEDDNIKGFELEFMEEGQDFYKGSGTVFVD